MKSLNPYLNFAGDTEEAFNFYKSVFGGEFSLLMRFGETPAGQHLKGDELNKIMHIALPIKDKFTIMATDALESMGHPLKMGDNVNLAIEADTKDEADRYYNGLGAGGKVTSPIGDQFWGAYFGAVKDKFGVNWMISYNPQV